MTRKTNLWNQKGWGFPLLSQLKFIFFLSIVLLLFSSCKGKERAMHHENGAELTIFNVMTQKVERGTIADYIKLGGDVTTETNIDVYPNVSYGKILKINCHIGKRVKKGDPLVVIDPSLPGSTFAANSVFAPISGYVTALYAQVGAVVSNTVPVVRIGVLDNPSDIYVKTYIPEKYVSSVKVGMLADLYFSYKNEPLKAKVREISPVIDPASRTFEVWLRFLAYDPSIRVGSFPDIKLYIENKKGVIKVPLGAVVNRGKEQMVFVYDDSGEKPVARQKIVECGIRIDGEYEIKSGLEMGELLIVKGQTLLVEGALVQDSTLIGSNKSEEAVDGASDLEN